MSEQGFPVTSRFRIMDNPNILPGKCAVCGAVDRPVIDFATTIPRYGAILLCFSCTQEAARGVGMVAKEELDAAQESLAQTFNEMLISHNVIGISREQFDVLTLAVANLSDVILFGHASDAAMVARSTGESESSIFDDDATYDLGAEGFEQGDTGTPEQDDNIAVSERPARVSSGHGDGISTIEPV
jgi:hypothetical protein